MSGERTLVLAAGRAQGPASADARHLIEPNCSDELVNDLVLANARRSIRRIGPARGYEGVPGLAASLDVARWKRAPDPL